MSALKETKVSIIIPVYNAAKTISRCLDSIIANNYNNYEVIIVDDGSTDCSDEVIKKYAEQNNRIHLLKQSNKGPSAARNLALRQSTGDIICFVDSDDYVSDDYLSSITQAFDENEADVVFMEYARVNPEGKIISVHHLPEMTDNYYRNLMSLSERDIYGYTWIKAFKQTTIYGHSFNETLCLFEDELLTCEIMKTPRRLFFLRQTLYYYVVQNTGGSKLTGKTFANYYDLCEKVYLAWKDLIMNRFEGWDDFLQKKSNHMSQNCKWYILERKVDPKFFFKGWSACIFLQRAKVQDKIINAVQQDRFLAFLIFYLLYKSKIKISEMIHTGKN